MDVVSAIVTAVVTVGILLAGGTVAAIAVIARRGKAPRPVVGGAPTRQSIQALERSAGSALVRLDDLIHDAEDELGFAIAQFGEADAREFRDAIDVARRDIQEAFALKQKLNDSEPGHRPPAARLEQPHPRARASPPSGCSASRSATFDARRRRESNAPDDWHGCGTRSGDAGPARRAPRRFRMP